MTTTKNATIVKFHTGRGGRFNNPGHVTFVGCERIDEGHVFDSLFLNEDETEYVGDSGNEVELSVEDAETGVGTINIDNGYNTTTATYISDCDHSLLAAIAEADPYNVKELLIEANYFEDDSVIDILTAFNLLDKTLSDDYAENTLLFAGIEEITEAEFDLDEAERQEIVNGKFYKID